MRTYIEIYIYICHLQLAKILLITNRKEDRGPRDHFSKVAILTVGSFSICVGYSCILTIYIMG